METPRTTWLGPGEAEYTVQGRRFHLDRDGWRSLDEPSPIDAELEQGVLPAIVHHLNHRLVLHASTLAKGDQAIAIAAASGGGKSTMAAALRAQGFDLVADDHLVVEDRDGVLVALPGPPQTRVWREVAQHFDVDLTNAKPILDARDKWIVEADVVPGPVPLSHWFVLERGSDELEIDEVQPAEAHREAFRNRFIIGLVNQRREPWYFDLVTRLANEVPCSRVKVPEGLAHADEAARVVAEYAGTSATS